MKLANMKLWQKCVTVILVLCLVCTAFGQFLPTKADNGSKASGPKTYTVELKNAGNVFLGSATETTGPVTITYEVEAGSVSHSYAQAGAIVTKNPTALYPYDGDNGAMAYDHTGCYVLNAGYKHTITIEKTAENQAKGSYYVDGLWSSTYPFGAAAGNGSADAKYFGLWLGGGSGNNSAKLVNVTCTDANGNDLGLQTNSEACVITEDGAGTTPSVPSGPKTYTVELKNAGNVFLGSATETTGPVTITYEVEAGSVSHSYAQAGAIVTKNPAALYPYDGDNGAMAYDHTGCYVLNAGYKHTITIEKTAENQAKGSYYVDGLWTSTYPFGATAGNGSADAKYFGLWLGGGSGNNSAKLVNVTCTDANGNDLGLQTNSEACVITENNTTKPAEAVKYTVELKDATNVFLGNATPTEGPVTIKYEVESANHTFKRDGLIATAKPTIEHPYNENNGSMQFENAMYFLNTGHEYTITIGKGADGKVTGGIESLTQGWSSWTPGVATGNGNADSKYFGMWFSEGTGTAKLVNVTCTDASGNDLGLQTNTSACVITAASSGGETGGDEPDDNTPIVMEPGDASKATKYNVTLGEVGNVFLSNELASEKVVTLRYTVKSASLSSIYNNGVSATADPKSSYPYTLGSMLFHPAENVVMTEGRTYTWVLALDQSGKVVYKGSYTDAENTTPVTIDETFLPNPAGDGKKTAKYFGIYINPTTTAKLTNVSCVDSDGKDLGIQVNATNVLITTGQDEGQGKTEKLDSSYQLITLGNFGLADGAYHSGIKYGSYPLSMHKKAFTVDIEFSIDVGEDLRYGSQPDGWHGLRFWSDASCLYMEDVDGHSEQYTFIPLIAGTTLVGKEINLKLSTEYVDSDGDGKKDDVKLGVWFNDKLYNNEYIFLKDYKGVLGKNLGLYSSNDIAQLKVKSIAGIETGVDYTIFGFTKNWMQEMGIR